MTAPVQLNFKLPSQNKNGSAIDITKLAYINVGLRPDSGTAGTYPTVVKDTAFTADASGISHEPLSAFTTPAPGKYWLACQTVMGVAPNLVLSDWSTECVWDIPEPIPVPLAPSQLSLS